MLSFTPAFQVSLPLLFSPPPPHFTPPPPHFYRPAPNHLHSYVSLAQTIYHASPCLITSEILLCCARVPEGRLDCNCNKHLLKRPLMAPLSRIALNGWIWISPKLTSLPCPLHHSFISMVSFIWSVCLCECQSARARYGTVWNVAIVSRCSDCRWHPVSRDWPIDRIQSRPW